MAFGMTASERSFRNLTLSYRGSERQPPNVLQLALRFSRVMELDDGSHPPGTSTEERLMAVVHQFHDSEGLSQRHRMDEDKLRSVYNLIAGSSNVFGTYIHSPCHFPFSFEWKVFV